MKTNLSSQISLHRVSPRYYRPENAFEKSVLTRLEKIPTDIYESVEEGANYIAREIAQTIREKQKAGRFCVLALPGGDSPSHVYTELIRMHKEEGLSFRNVIVFNMYEYYPLSPDAINSNFNALKSMLLDHIDIDKQNIFTPDGSIAKDTIFEYCRLYEQRIESFGGIDIALLGIGRVGNIAFNEPGSRLNSTTRLILLDNASRNEASKIFGTLDNTPISSITMGVATILGAKKVYLLAWGENKAAMIKECVEGPITDTIPASYLQTHNNAHVALDLSAAMNLTRIQRPWLVTSCEWNDKLIRSAIVWLCQLTGKPILKLTNKDYNENGLSELLALYGSAYNVNIKIFNDLQHTITGWPGGKPNADDTYRPERAKPYPKRVVIFSPHPDDDVISMGGTLRRLVEQKHEVHVAYETSGNIAVGDEEVVRFMHFINGFNQLFNNSEDLVINEKYIEIFLYFYGKGERMKIIKNGWDFFQDQILGMHWLKDLIGKLLVKAGLGEGRFPGEFLHFFLYDIIKIFVLLAVLIFVISYIQSYFPPEKSKKIMGRFHGIWANLIGALLGTVTPFCSCSSIPIFMGFTSAGLPLGVTFSFLISSPMVDLGSLILLMSVFGGKIASAYVLVGLVIAVIGGTFIERLHMEALVVVFLWRAPHVEVASPSLPLANSMDYA